MMMMMLYLYTALTPFFFLKADMFLFSLCYSSSGASVVAIDNKIEQAMVSSSATLDVANVSVSLKKNPKYNTVWFDSH